MIAIRLENKVLYPKLTIKSCIALEQLYGSPTKIIETNIPKLEDQVFLISLSLQQYHLTEDELYEVIDGLDDPLELILRLYEESGLITPHEDLELVEAKETTSMDELEQEPQTFEEMVSDMLKNILEINLMTIDKFYDSTLQEVVMQAEAYKKYKKNKSLDNALEIYQLADLTSQAVARLLSKDAKMPDFKKYFSYLLEDEKEPTDSDGLTAEERLLSAQITEWAIAMQRKQENKRVESKTE